VSGPGRYVAPDNDVDVDGEDAFGRELLAARLATEGRFLIFETIGGYLAVPCGVETFSDVSVSGLLARLPKGG
jgi:hypothetical protein